MYSAMQRGTYTHVIVADATSAVAAAALLLLLTNSICIHMCEHTAHSCFESQSSAQQICAREHSIFCPSANQAQTALH